MRPASDIPMLPRPYRVVRVRRELPDVSTLWIEPADGAAQPPYIPGQFNMLYAFGVGEAAISISGDPTEGGPLLHTIRAVGHVTQALCDLRVGAALGVRGPFGAGWPMQAAEGADVLLVAGGVGLAPLRPALYQVLSQRARYGQVALCYGARTPDALLYEAELQRWRGRFDLQVEVTVDHARAPWAGHVGPVTNLLSRVRYDPTSTVALLCGPEVMMQYAVMELQRRGVPDGQLHVSLERNMKCAIGLCGHCQLGPHFVCQDGPVFPLSRVAPLWRVREL